MIWLWDAVYGVWRLDLSTTSLRLRLRLSHTKISPLTPHLKRYISVRVHPYVHPQHLKELKHFVYMTWLGDAVSGGLEPQPWSYNITLTPNFPKIHPHPNGHNSVRVHPYAHPQHLKVLKHCAYICHGWGMQSLVVWSLNHVTATSLGLGLSHAPNFLKIHPPPIRA
jgi:hypothetical protein